MTRIIAGKWRGKHLPSVGGGIRPTADRAREALFSILTSRGCFFAQQIWVDLFAGTGAIGFEALSRGASQVIFVDHVRQHLQRIEEFALQLQAKEVVKTITLKLPSPQLAMQLQPYCPNICFADPPFDLLLEPDVLLADPFLTQALAVDAYFIWEQEQTVKQNVLKQPVEYIGNWQLQDQRRYGRIEFLIYQKMGDLNKLK